MSKLFNKHMNIELFAAFLDDNLSNLEREEIRDVIENDAMLSDIYDASLITDEFARTDNNNEDIINDEYNYKDVNIPRLSESVFEPLINHDAFALEDVGQVDSGSLPLMASFVEGSIFDEQSNDVLMEDAGEEDIDEEASDDDYDDDLSED